MDQKSNDQGKAKTNATKPKEEVKFDIPQKIELKNLGSIDKKNLAHFSPSVQLQLNDLMKNEKLILDKLSQPAQERLFFENPKEFFIKNKIEVSPFILKKLKEFDFSNFQNKESFVMPNGQTITPNIKINIVKK